MITRAKAAEIAARLRGLAHEVEAAFDHGEDAQVAMERSCQSKRRYKSAEGAGQAAVSAQARGESGLRVYQCPFCQSFHLTKGDLAGFAERHG